MSRQYAAISVTGNSSAVLGDVNHHYHHQDIGDDERKLVADWYSRAGFAEQQTDHLSRRAEGTGGWFLASPEYQYWRSNANKTLMCPGIPGSGKSIMVATIVDDLWDQYAGDINVAIAYLYCSYNRQSEQNLRHMLGALVRQLFQEQEELPLPVKNLYTKHRNRGTSPSVDELKELLRKLSDLYNRLFIVIDALDECSNIEQDRDQLLDELFILQKQKRENTNILATSRPVPDVTERFQRCPQIEIRAHDEDMNIFFDRHMARLGRFVQRDSRLREEIKRSITKAAQGMFLLARLQFDSLRDKTNLRKIEEALANFDKSSNALDNAYNDVMNRIDQQLDGWRELARKVLLWITHSHRPLSIRELQEAVAIEPQMEDLDHEKDMTDEGHLVSVCHGLVEIDQESRIIRLVHYTTQAYLDKIRLIWFPNGQTEIAQSCLTYLSLRIFAHDECKLCDGWPSMHRDTKALDEIETRLNFDEWLSIPPISEVRPKRALNYVGSGWGDHACLTRELSVDIMPYQFLRYAGEYWGFHASESDDKELQTRIVKLLLTTRCLQFLGQFILQKLDNEAYAWRKESQLDIWKLCILELNSLKAQISALHICAHFGLEQTLLQLIASDQSVNEKDRSGRTSLSWAAERGYANIVQQLLLQRDIAADSKDASGLTALFWAVKREQITVMQHLLARSDVEPDYEDENCASPFRWAAANGHIKAVKCLLELRNLPINAKDKFGRTPLSLAAENGHINVVRYVLTRPDIQASAVDLEGRTPLSYAAAKLNVEVVRELLACPEVIADTKDRYGNTAIYEILRRQHVQFVQLRSRRTSKQYKQISYA